MIEIKTLAFPQRIVHHPRCRQVLYSQSHQISYLDRLVIMANKKKKTRAALISWSLEELEDITDQSGS